MSDALIAKLQAYGRLSDEDISLLKTVTRHRRDANAGSNIIQEGDNPRDVHLVISGTACRYKMLENGRRQIVAIVLPGDFCDLHVFVLKHMDHTIGALSDVCYVTIRPEEINMMLSRSALARALLKSTLVDEAVLREWIANIGQRPAYQRVAHLFCELHTRLDLVNQASNNTIELCMSQEQLGDATGLSAIHINRSLAKLKEKKLINVRNKLKIKILDLEGLVAISGFQRNYLHLD